MADRLRHVFASLREVIDEMDYGGRRALELRTGYVYTDETERRQVRAEIERLEQLYEREL